MDSVTHASSGALIGMAISQWVLPDASISCILLGAIAGSLSDLDFLAEFRGKIAAWKYHRILTHNIPVAFFLTLVLTGIASFTLHLPLHWVFLLCTSAAALHLLLDVLTSFGTCLNYPLSSKRYSTRSHFIVDPIILLICLYGLISNNAWQAIVVLMLYIVFGLLLKTSMYKHIKASLPVHLDKNSLQLEPIFLAPFRWLVIVKGPESSEYCYQNLIWQSDWYSVDHKFEEFEALCQQHELMQCVLKTFDLPLYHFQFHADQHYLVVEDLKWRAEPGFRPLAFTLKLKRVNQQWQITDAEQGGFFQRDDSLLFQPPVKLPS